MPKYTTGDIARLCGVSVRTVQYYDSRGVLVPSELSEGGRRLYTDEDVKKLRIICFLRDAGISVGSIGELFKEAEPGRAVEVLIAEQEELLHAEIAERREKLERLEGMRREMKSMPEFSVESIGDIAYLMAHKKEMTKFYALLIFMGILLDIAQLGCIFLWIFTGAWQPFALYLPVQAGFAVWVIRAYRRRVVYICPRCHEVFEPAFREWLWARHTPTVRRLTCVKCGYRGYCVETWRKEDEKNG